MSESVCPNCGSVEWQCNDRGRVYLCGSVGNVAAGTIAQSGLCLAKCKIREQAEAIVRLKEERDRAVAMVPEFETLINNAAKYKCTWGERTRVKTFVEEQDIQRLVRALLRYRMAANPTEVGDAGQQ
jgi:hypothetical protein